MWACSKKGSRGIVQFDERDIAVMRSEENVTRRQ